MSFGFQIIDDNNCQTRQITGQHNCGCATSAGTRKKCSTHFRFFALFQNFILIHMYIFSESNKIDAVVTQQNDIYESSNKSYITQKTKNVLRYA